MSSLIITAGLAVLFASAFKISGQPDAYIELQPQALSITPKEFYIVRVDDERSDKTTIGMLQPVKNTQVAPLAPIKVDLKSGAEKAITAFIANGMAADKRLRPIIIKLKNLNVTERAAPDGYVAGRIGVVITFGYEQEDDFVKLGDYTTASTYRRNAGPPQYVEPMLRIALVNALTYLDNWMDKQADTNIKLAKGVKVSFSNYTEAPEGDTIYYDPNRPLKWGDFQLKPQNSRYAAEVFASLGYTEEVKVVKGIINVKLNIKVYLPKSACWAKPEAMTAGSLLHEQHHFDIVRIVAEHFKQQVLAEKLSTSNFDGPINMAYFDALREINVLQKQYDNETAHSTNAYQQQQWNARIDKELQALSITRLTAQAAGRN